MQVLTTKYELEAKQAREKKVNERRKSVLILILRYLMNLGFADAAFKLQEEAKLGLDKFDVADNIDLYMIVCGYEDYFEMKFDKPLTLIKNIESNSKLPNIKYKDIKDM